MKKLIKVSTILGIALLICGSAYVQAADDAAIVGVELVVGQMFSIDIAPADLDLILADPLAVPQIGDTVGAGTTLYCGTNLGNSWYVNVKSSDFAGSATAETIPLSSFTFMTFPVADSEGVSSAGTFVSTNTALSTADQLAYTAADGEESDTDCRIGMYFTVDIPWEQTADTYSATVTCTMTE